MPLIQQDFNKQSEFDNVMSTLRFKKLPTPHYYFLNMSLLQPQKRGLVNTVNQTFYLTKKISEEQNGDSEKAKLENKYTLITRCTISKWKPRVQECG